MKKWGPLLIQLMIGTAAFAGSVMIACSSQNNLLAWYDNDDAFFYFKVAQNVIAGQGFTFDGINPTNGFHPLWMVICLGVFFFFRTNLFLPLRVLALISGAFNAGSAILLYHLLKKLVRPGVALTGAFIWALLPSIYNVTTVHGMESSVSTFLILLLLARFFQSLDFSERGLLSTGNLIVTGILAGLVILARLDNLFLAGVIGIFLVFRIVKIPRELLRDGALIAAATILPYFLLPEFFSPHTNPFSIAPMFALGMIIFPASIYLAGGYAGGSQKKNIRYWIKLGIGLGIGCVVYAGLGGLLNHLSLIQYFSKKTTLLACALTTLFLLHTRSRPDRQSSGESAPDLHQLLAKWTLHWKRILRDALCYGCPILILLGSYMLWNKTTFGIFMPVSGQVKQWWSSMQNTPYTTPSSLETVLEISPSGEVGPWSLTTSAIHEAAESLGAFLHLDWFPAELILFLFVLLLAMLVVSLILVKGKVFQNKRAVLLLAVLFIGCSLQIAYYRGMGYSGERNWYWVSEMIMQVILAVLVLESFLTLMVKIRVRQYISTLFCLVLCLSVIYLHARFLLRLAPLDSSKNSRINYLQEITDLQQLTPKESVIGMTGGGTIAYFLPDRTVVNLDGLINSAEYFSVMKNGKGGEFLDKIPLDYVYGNPYMLFEADPFARMLNGRLREIGYIDGAEKFTLYEYVPHE